MSVKITYFVHGTTTDNENGLATGWAPGELSEIGQVQARSLGDLVKNAKFDIVFCSDLKRAVDSAVLGFGEKYFIVADARLREANYGQNTGQRADEFKSDMTIYIEKPFSGGESYRDVERRLADFCKFLKSNYNHKHVAIVAHEAPQLALEVLLMGRTWKQAMAENWRHTKSWRPGWEYEIV